MSPFEESFEKLRAKALAYGKENPAWNSVGVEAKELYILGYCSGYLNAVKEIIKGETK